MRGFSEAVKIRNEVPVVISYPNISSINDKTGENKTKWKGIVDIKGRKPKKDHEL